MVSLNFVFVLLLKVWIIQILIVVKCQSEALIK